LLQTITHLTNIFVAIIQFVTPVIAFCYIIVF
jgi:hypothetical protein